MLSRSRLAGIAFGLLLAACAWCQDELSLYAKWANEDVVSIISAEEKAAFATLQTGAERERFIEQFWLRRNPSPATLENPLKEEHYRRIAWANERFASDIPGWRTDRGRIYIFYGPPDEVESHPFTRYVRPPEEGGGEATAYPFEQWRYQQIPGVGKNIAIEFVDHDQTGRYPLSFAAEIDLLRTRPASLPDPFARPQPEPPDLTRMFAHIPPVAAPRQSPQTPLSTMEQALTGAAARDFATLSARAYYFPLTNASAMANLVLPVPAGTVQLIGRIVSSRGATAEAFEVAKPESVYTVSVSLFPGAYRLQVAAANGAGKVSLYQAAVTVPSFDGANPVSSTIVLGARSGSGEFLVGTALVHPRLSGEFKQAGEIGILLQIRNPPLSGQVRYRITRKVGGDQVYESADDLSRLPFAAPSQATVEKWLAPGTLPPGHYALEVTITGTDRNQTAAAAVDLTVI